MLGSAAVYLVAGINGQQVRVIAVDVPGLRRGISLLLRAVDVEQMEVLSAA